MNNKLLTFCLFWVFISPCLYAETLIDQANGLSSSHVEVVVIGGDSKNGKAVLSIFDSEENFLESPVITLHKSADKEGTIRFQLSDLLDRYYSVSVFFDEDENGELNTNFFGIPSEPVGFSNNAKGRFGPPSFEQTKFKPSDNDSIEIKLLTIGD